MLLFLLFLFPLAYSRMYCGLDPMTNFLMEVQVKLDCRPIFRELYSGQSPQMNNVFGFAHSNHQMEGKTEYERVEFQTRGIARWGRV